MPNDLPQRLLDLSLLALLVFLLSLTASSCNEKETGFELSPQDTLTYAYSYTKISSILHSGNTRGDTVNLVFRLQKLKDVDTLVRFKLSFDEMSWKRSPVKISFIGADAFNSHGLRNPFAILDSINFFLKGKWVELNMKKNGEVHNIEGVERLIDDIANEMNESNIEILSDHFSVKALTDLFNRMFAYLPAQRLTEQKQWVRDVDLVTKAPIHVSTLNTLNHLNGDTANIGVASEVSAKQGREGPVYMKGKETGVAMISYSTGLPFHFETRGEKITTTSHYEVKETEDIIFKKIN